MDKLDKLEDLREGDRLRVTTYMTYSGPDTIQYLTLSDMVKYDPDCQIERIEPPLKVGDRVEWDGPSCESSGCVMAIADGFAMIMKDGFLTPVVVDVRLLQRERIA